VKWRSGGGGGVLRVISFSQGVSEHGEMPFRASVVLVQTLYY